VSGVWCRVANRAGQAGSQWVGGLLIPGLWGVRVSGYAGLPAIWALVPSVGDVLLLLASLDESTSPARLSRLWSRSRRRRREEACPAGTRIGIRFGCLFGGTT